MGTLGDLVKQKRALMGWSQERLGFELGYSKPAIGKLERGEVASPGNSDRLAAFLGITREEMDLLIDAEAVRLNRPTKRRMLQIDDSRPKATVVKLPRRRQLELDPEPFQPEGARNLVGYKNLPVYAAAMGGNGHAIITFEAIDYVKRPSVLETVRDAYAIYIVGDSMIPAYRPGDLGLVNPHLPLARDSDVVLFHVPPADEAECIIKHLVSYSPTDYHLEQYNPHETFTESRADWPHCHQVVGKYNRR